MTTNDDQYVPTDGDMRWQYVVKRMCDGATRTHAEREYTRWLAAHDARVRRDARGGRGSEPLSGRRPGSHRPDPEGGLHVTTQPTRDQRDMWRQIATDAGDDPYANTLHPDEVLALLDQLDQAEHRIARLEAQSDIRGRAVVMCRERAREAEARVRAARAIHRDLYESMFGVPYCDECDRAWPCPTIRALEGWRHDT